MRRLLLLLLAAAATVAGCAAAPVEGTPSPAAGATPESTGPVLPPRPRELPLDGIDACSLLTPAQRAELGLDGLALPSQTTSTLFAGRACAISGFEPRDVAVGLTLATRNGIEALIEPGRVRDQLTLTAVLDFPAVIARPAISNACSVDIDVADGQFLDVLFRDAGTSPPIPQEQLCNDAVKIAEAALRTLKLT